MPRRVSQFPPREPKRLESCSAPAIDGWGRCDIQDTLFRRGARTVSVARSRCADVRGTQGDNLLFGREVDRSVAGLMFTRIGYDGTLLSVPVVVLAVAFVVACAP